MAGEWKALVVPDYSETLERIAEEMSAITEQLEALAEKPGLKLTPESLSVAIIKAGSAARAEDHAALVKATAGFQDAERKITGVVASARTAEQQARNVKRMCAIGVATGMLALAIIPGPIMRALPARWHLRERMATRALGTDAWEGGQRLMMFAHPDHWNQLSMADRILRANDRTVQDCAIAAAKTRKFVRCTVTISPE